MSEKARQWDQAAAEFQRTFELGLNPYIRSCLSFWEENGMIFPGCRALDVGCGVGKYGTLLAARGCDVTLTDISEKMLAFAEKNMSASFPASVWRTFCCDFDEADIDTDVFHPRFDFCFSTMSPAVHDEKTLKKFSALSRGWCFIAGFTASDAVLRRRIKEAVGFAEPAGSGEPLAGREHTTVAQLAEMLRAMDYLPETKSVPYHWSDRRTVRAQAELMRERCWKDAPEADEYDRKALAYLESIADADGTVSDEVRTQVAWLSWKAEK
ncbi:MAG: methyltransferase domain-containing protein [Lachnospiraceae bacterium]|nr:methyltransferase domain-containing protein [Lachnospiraceae bacterium]